MFSSHNYPQFTVHDSLKKRNDTIYVYIYLFVTIFKCALNIRNIQYICMNLFELKYKHIYLKHFQGIIDFLTV